MTTVPVLADRVMKARRESVCILCGGLVRVGQQMHDAPAANGSTSPASSATGTT